MLCTSVPIIPHKEYASQIFGSTGKEVCNLRYYIMWNFVIYTYHIVLFGQ